MSTGKAPSNDSSSAPEHLEGPTGFAPVQDNLDKSPAWLPWAGVAFACAALFLFGINALTPDSVPEVPSAETASEDGTPNAVPEAESD